MKKFKPQSLLIYFVLLIMTAIYIGPFLFSLSISFKEPQDVFSWPIKLLPEKWTLQNYVNVWQGMPFGRWLFNSALIAAVQTISNLFFASLAGFTFARLRFPGKNLIFVLFLSSLMIPGIILLVPQFILLNEFHLVNSYAGLILPGFITVVSIFLMKQFFETIPKDLEDAARIDGCSHFRIFWQIFLPLSTPALAAVAIYTFQGSWNAFLWPIIVTTTKEMFTLPVGMAFFRSEFQVQWTLLMAGTMLISLPTLIVFLVFQRHFVQGIAAAGLKE